MLPKESIFYFSYAQKILFTSSLLGIELCAPFLVTATEENTLANLIAFSILIFSDNPVTKAPLKQSPAAVVSTASGY